MFFGILITGIILYLIAGFGYLIFTVKNSKNIPEKTPTFINDIEVGDSTYCAKNHPEYIVSVKHVTDNNYVLYTDSKNRTYGAPKHDFIYKFTRRNTE